MNLPTTYIQNYWPKMVRRGILFTGLSVLVIALSISFGSEAERSSRNVAAAKVNSHALRICVPGWLLTQGTSVVPAANLKEIAKFYRVLHGEQPDLNSIKAVNGKCGESNTEDLDLMLLRSGCSPCRTR